MPADERTSSEELRRLNGVVGIHRVELVEEKPAEWTTDYLAKLLVQAARYWKRHPDIKRPRKPGNHHPEIKYEWEDLLAQQTLSEAEKKQRAEEYNRQWMKVRLTPQEMTVASATQDWLVDLRKAKPLAAAALGRWAVLRAYNLNVGERCDARGVSRRTFYACRGEGLQWLTDQLNQRRVAVI